jgi:hypothetical protein
MRSILFLLFKLTVLDFWDFLNDAAKIICHLPKSFPLEICRDSQKWLNSNTFSQSPLTDKDKTRSPISE